MSQPFQPGCIRAKAGTVVLATLVGLFNMPTQHIRADGPDRSVASNTVQIGEYNYAVEMTRDGAHKLELVWWNKAAEGSTAERVLINGSTIPRSHPIKELKLAPWSGGNLVSIAIAKGNNREEAYLLLVPLPVTSVEPPVAPFKKVYDSAFPLTVLAANGSFQGDGIVVLFGELVRDKATGERSVQSAAVFLDDCPGLVVYGTISEFRRKE
jgi:hypothetical protein